MRTDYLALGADGWRDDRSQSHARYRMINPATKEVIRRAIRTDGDVLRVVGEDVLAHAEEAHGVGFGGTSNTTMPPRGGAHVIIGGINGCAGDFA